MVKDSLGHLTEAQNILLVEDNDDLVATLNFMLKQNGFNSDFAKKPQDALEKLSRNKFDLILLDVMLSGESGLELCQEIRRRPKISDTPIIFLSAKSEEIDKVVAFEMGADDYVTKPFSVKELLLRINAVLRRHHKIKEKSEEIGFGLLSINFSIPRVTVSKQEIYLTPLELRLLDILFKRKGRVQSRSRLLSEVWNIDADISTRTVDTHIKRLREKLLGASDYIKTIRGIGYRFLTEQELSG